MTLRIWISLIEIVITTFFLFQEGFSYGMRSVWQAVNPMVENPERVYALAPLSVIVLALVAMFVPHKTSSLIAFFLSTGIFVLHALVMAYTAALGSAGWN